VFVKKISKSFFLKVF